jgi:hypothetical protein
VVRAIGMLCQVNNLTLNVNKTKEIIMDFRKPQREQPPIHIDGTVVEKVENFMFLGIHIKHSQTSTDAQSRASCWAVSPAGTATTPSTTVRLSRG